MAVAQRRLLKSTAAFRTFGGAVSPHVCVKSAELIAKALRAISEETGYEGLAEALASNWKASSTRSRSEKAAEQALMDAELDLARTLRLSLLGELAGSIIHEINQPLSGIVMSAEACLRWLARDPAEPGEARKSAMRVIEQGRRASEVVTGLRSLLRDAQLRFADVQINDAIEETLLPLKRDIERAGITLRTALDCSMPTVEGNRVQLQQVVLNLVRNAIDAMAGVNGRPRILTASSKVADDQVSVAIADTGVGIATTSRERLFDALYTTKGDGLGLGLSICRRIITVHGGRLWAEENTAHGATFTFTLPTRQSGPMSGS